MTKKVHNAVAMGTIRHGGEVIPAGRSFYMEPKVLERLLKNGASFVRALEKTEPAPEAAGQDSATQTETQQQPAAAPTEASAEQPAQEASAEQPAQDGTGESVVEAIAALDGVEDTLAEKLVAAGFTVEKLAAAKIKDLTPIKGIGDATAKKVIASAKVAISGEG